MLLSMTGFGAARSEEGPLSVSVELRSINNRYFKLSLRSTEFDASLEPRVETLLRPFIRRGTVQVNVRIERARTADDFTVNREVLTGYRRQLDEIASEWHVSDPVSLEALLDLPGVIEEIRADSGSDEAWPLIERTVREAAEKLVAMRAEEGKALAADLAGNVEAIAGWIEEIRGRSEAVVDEYRERLMARVGKVLAAHDVELATSDVLREVSLLAERSDVSEEIVRLRSHLDQFTTLMDSKESLGRKLDFLTQEMFRETNTIGSKSGDVEIGRRVIDVKTAIERMREQVQNVE